MTAFTSGPTTLTIVAVPASVGGSSGIPAWATDANLPPGAVRAISLNTIADCWEGPQPGGGGDIRKSVDAWTSGIDAPLLGPHGSKVWAGGGDGDGWDTSAYAFDYATQRWSRIKDRTTALSWNPGRDAAAPAGDPTRFDVVYCEHGDGTPGAPHSYDAYCYVPPVASGAPLGALTRPVSRFMYTTRSTNYSHKLALGTSNAGSAWSRASIDAGILNPNALAACDYDPTTRSVYTLSMTESGFWSRGIDRLDLSAGTGVGTHSLVSFGADQLVGGDACVRFWRGPDNDRRYLVWLNFGKPAIVDLDAVGAGIANPPCVHPFPNFGNGGSGLAWCSPLKCFFVKCARPVSEANTLYKLIPPAADVRSGPWTVEKIDLVDVTGATNGIWKRLHYVEALRALTWFYHAAGPVYAYRPLGNLDCHASPSAAGGCAGPGFGLMDWERYLRENPDVAGYVDAHLEDFFDRRSNGTAWHFTIHGSYERRAAYDVAGAALTLERLFEPFDWTRYLQDNRDVAAHVDANLPEFGGSAARGAIWHYTFHGWNEGRTVFDRAGAPIGLDWRQYFRRG